MFLTVVHVAVSNIDIASLDQDDFNAVLDVLDVHNAIFDLLLSASLCSATKALSIAFSILDKSNSTIDSSLFLTFNITLLLSLRTVGNKGLLKRHLIDPIYVRGEITHLPCTDNHKYRHINCNQNATYFLGKFLKTFSQSFPQ